MAVAWTRRGLVALWAEVLWLLAPFPFLWLGYSCAIDSVWPWSSPPPPAAWAQWDPVANLPPSHSLLIPFSLPLCWVGLFFFLIYFFFAACHIWQPFASVTSCLAAGRVTRAGMKAAVGVSRELRCRQC